MTSDIILEDAYKKFTLDQDKILTPEETVNHFRTRLAQIDLDILERTKRIDNGRLGIPVYFSTCGKDAKRIIGTRKQMGKGATPSQAEASAVMELAERFSFFSFSRNPDNFRTCRYVDLKEPTIPFDLIARSVHDDTDELDITRKAYETLEMRWTRAYNLSRREKLWIPFDWFFAINEYNGPSAGNCQEEALSQGICEVVERHVSSAVSRNHMRVPAIDPASARDAMVVDMLGKYGNVGVQLFISDFTLNMGIPSVGVLAYDPATFPEKSELVWTAGTTPDPEKALSRALTEVAQLAGDFNTGSNYVASGLPKFSGLDEARYITHPDQTLPVQNLPDLSHENIRVEVENMISALSQNDFEVIVVDTMHPLLQIPAFYTIIPGAHFRERSANTSVGMFSTKLMTEKLPPAKAINKLLEIDGVLPGRHYIQFYLGTCHQTLQQYETAYDFFKKAMDCHPDDQDMAAIFSYMGACQKDMGNYREALGTLAKGVQLDNERTDLFNLMGFCHFKLKEHQKAIECFQAVLKLDPSSAIDYANIASNYRDMGDKEKAIEYYSKAVAIDPGIEFAWENLRKLQ